MDLGILWEVSRLMWDTYNIVFAIVVVVVGVLAVISAK